MKQYDSFSAEDTYRIGYELGANAQPGDIYAMDGDLGVGKTVFTKGVAAGLGITATVNSPTFTILQIYEGGRIPLYHFDVYRIEEPEEMEEVGIDDYLYGQGICLIEWAEQIRDILPPECGLIRIEKDLGKGVEYRKIQIYGVKTTRCTTMEQL